MLMSERHVGRTICSGMIALAKPANNGVANSSSMIVPCGEELVEALVEVLHARPGELGPHRHGQNAAEQEEDHRRDEVEIADHLVISGNHPLPGDRAQLTLGVAISAAVAVRSVVIACPPRTSSQGVGLGRTLGFADLSLGHQRLQVVVVVVLAHDVHIEQHRRVIGAAKFGALPGEYTLGCRSAAGC